MRLDNYLHINNYCDSRTKAQNFIKNCRVTVNGKEITKASFEVSDSDEVKLIDSDEYNFVGRGGNKLEYALNTFNISVENHMCVDIGSSTGGFTECLLIHGASKVYAIDSGKDQLNPKLRADSRVVSIEGFNARNLTTSDIDNSKADTVVMDVSFISQTLLYPAILGISKPGTNIITLIKPQFEAGKSALDKHGVVKDEKIRVKVVNDIIETARNFGFEYISHSTSPIKGGDGNVEFLLYLKVK